MPDRQLKSSVAEPCQLAPSETPEPTSASPVSTYRAPQVTDLGAWQSLTLIYSLPIGPGGPPSP